MITFSHRLPKQRSAILRHDIVGPVRDPADIDALVRAVFVPLIADEGGP